MTKPDQISPKTREALEDVYDVSYMWEDAAPSDIEAHLRFIESILHAAKVIEQERKRAARRKRTPTPGE
jgi:hypothetical protein